MAEAEPKKRRARRRDRSETQADLRQAALALLDSQGPLAGLSLQDVADRANVNRVQIYQYYGTRQALLRAAIAELLENGAADRETLRKLPFVERRLAMFDHFMSNPTLAKLEAILAYDGDPELSVFPEIALARVNLENDVRNGHLPADADALVAHALTSATYRGYCIYREVMAHDTGIPIAELDVRARKVFRQMLEGIAGKATPDTADG